MKARKSKLSRLIIYFMFVGLMWTSSVMAQDGNYPPTPPTAPSQTAEPAQAESPNTVSTMQPAMPEPGKLTGEGRGIAKETIKASPTPGIKNATIQMPPTKPTEGKGIKELSLKPSSNHGFKNLTIQKPSTPQSSSGIYPETLKIHKPSAPHRQAPAGSKQGVPSPKAGKSKKSISKPSSTQ